VRATVSVDTAQRSLQREECLYSGDRRLRWLLMVQSSRRVQRSPLSDRSYRLIDRFCEPHPQLDGRYPSIDEALADAIGWLQLNSVHSAEQLIGVEVSSANGEWRTCRLPALLLCVLEP